MIRFLRTLGLVALCCLLAAFYTSCSPTPKVMYYSLYSTPPPNTVIAANDDIVLSVGPVTLADVLNKSKITTGGEGGVFIRSEYHRWVGPVDRDFTRALVEQLIVELGTEKIVLYPNDNYFDPNYQVLIDVLAMDGNLAEDAKLTVRWTLVDRNGKRQPTTRHSQFRREPSDGSHRAWVRAQQENVQQLSVEIAVYIKERIKM